MVTYVYMLFYYGAVVFIGEVGYCSHTIGERDLGSHIFYCCQTRYINIKISRPNFLMYTNPITRRLHAHQTINKSTLNLSVVAIS